MAGQGLRGLTTTLALAACAPAPLEVAQALERPAMSEGALIQGRDGGLSTRLWDVAVWTYGDTVLNVPDALGQTWHHNSWGWTTDADPADGLNPVQAPVDEAGAPRHLIPPTERELAFNLAHIGDACDDPCGARWATWPGAAVWVDALGAAAVFYGLIYAEPGPYNFEGVGTGLAVWRGLDEDPVRAVVDADAEHPDLLWGADVPGLGLGPTVLDGWLYTFGCDGPGDGFPCVLARAPVERLQDPTAWTWYEGPGWSTDPGDARPLFEGAPILSVAWHTGLGAWLTVYSRPFDEAVVARVAPALTGPWSREVTLLTTPDAPYDAVHHAELDTADSVTITWSRPNGVGWFGTEHAVWTVTLIP